MSDYKGARYIGEDPIHLWDGSLIMKGEITDLLSEEAAMNDNNFEPVYNELKKEKVAFKQENEPERIKKKRGGR